VALALWKFAIRPAIDKIKVKREAKKAYGTYTSEGETGDVLHVEAVDFTIEDPENE
jgi:hypothetical protein